MLNETFNETLKEKIISTLCRIEGVSLSEAKVWINDELKLCQLMVYNETVESGLDQQRKAILARDPSKFGDDELWKKISKSGLDRYKHYDGFGDHFQNNPSGATIVRIGRELGMSTDDINSILSSYDRQTISFHRTDDLLFRYAEAKGWTYQRFVQELNFSGGEPNSTIVAKNDSWDSSFATRMNRLRLQQMCDSKEDWSEHPYPMIIKTFQENERNANGAPRRNMLKLLGWLSVDYFCCGYEVQNPKDNTPYNPKHAPSAFTMLCELAALDMDSIQSANHEEIVNCVINIIKKLLSIASQTSCRQIPSVEEISNLSGYNDASKLITLAVEREIKNRITKTEEKNKFSCDVNYIVNMLSQGKALEKFCIESTTDPESLIRSQIVLNVLSRLLIVCGQKIMYDKDGVPQNVVWKIKDDILTVFNALFMFPPKEKIAPQIRSVFLLEKQGRRTSEPSRAFLILLALYAYGFSLVSPIGKNSADSIRKYISDILDSSGYIPLGNSLFDRTIISLFQEAIHCCPSASTLFDRRENWCKALKEASERIVAQNPELKKKLERKLKSLTSGGWNYSELPKRDKGKKDTLESDRHDDSR